MCVLCEREHTDGQTQLSSHASIFNTSHGYSCVDEIISPTQDDKVFEECGHVPDWQEILRFVISMVIYIDTMS